MVLRGSPGTMSSQSFRRLACFQKSVSKASACPICSLPVGLVPSFYRKSEHQTAERHNMVGPGLQRSLPNSLYGIINLQKAARRPMDARMTKPKIPNIDEVVAIDIHTHAEEPCGMHGDDGYDDFQAQMAEYFKSPNKHPPTVPETAAYYRAKKIAAVIFPVDAERETGFRRYNNYEMLEVAAENSDVLIPFVSIDPHKGKLVVREARKLIEEFGVKGFKFHPTMQGFFPNDRMAYPLYE